MKSGNDRLADKERTMDLQEAIKAHSEWKMKLRSAIASHSTLDVETIAKDNCCALGKWLHGEAHTRFGKLQSYRECLRLHAAFHKEASGVATAINQARYSDAEKMLSSGLPYAVASQAVVIAIGNLKHEAKL